MQINTLVGFVAQLLALIFLRSRRSSLAFAVLLQMLRGKRAIDRQLLTRHHTAVAKKMGV